MNHWIPIITIGGSFILFSVVIAGSKTMVVPDSYNPSVKAYGYQTAYSKKQKASHGFASKGGFPSQRRATGNRVFIFSPRMRAWAAYDANGNLVRTGQASGGQGYCADIRRSCRTPSGVYRVISKGGPSCRSSRYPVGKGGAPMPYCMFFSRNYAIHGSPDVPNYNASHGCVRVLPSAAQWLSFNFIQIGTTVIVSPY